ncbi:MAG: response regulator [Oligoflexia bacterium]|nr:response regulator [Oligoflexia bacterium]
MKILVVEDESDLRDIIAFMLESRFGAQVLEAPSGNRAIEIIRENPDISCVVCDYRMEDGSGGDVFAFLRQNQPAMKFILCSSGPPDDYPEFREARPAAHFQKPFTAEQLSAGIREVLGLTPAAMAQQKPPRYCKIRTQTILKMDLLNCDLYVRLSDTKFVKVVNSGDVFGESDLLRYDEKRIEYLYIRIEEAEAFLQKFTRDVLTISKAKEAVPQDTAIVLNKATLEVVHEMTHRLGFTREVAELTKASVELALRCIRDDPRLSCFLQKLAVDPNSFISSHSSILAHVSCGIATMMSWNSESTRHKLALASFLHDMTLESDQLALVGDAEGLAAIEARFGESGRSTYVKHPEEAAKIARGMAEMPPDVDMILLQHHERPDGSGFPFQHNYRRLSPLSSVFIISHDIVTQFHLAGGDPDLAKFLLEREKLYSAGHFRKILATLQASLK